MKRKFIFILFIFIVLTCVAYSSFSSELTIDGISFVRADIDLRISNIELVDSNNVIENSKANYGIDSTSFDIYLQNTDSSITYRVTVSNKTSKEFCSLKIDETNSNSNVSYKIENFEVGKGYKGSSYTFLITFTTSLSNQSLKLDLKFNLKLLDKTLWDFGFDEDNQTYQLFVAPYTGKYLMEAWGAQGGYPSFHTIQENLTTTMGGYVSGNIDLVEGDTFYIYVGQTGSDNGKQTFNGGGRGGFNSDNQYTLDSSIIGNDYGEYGFSGGGASDIRLVSGDWNNFNSLKSRIMVAAGGGGDGTYDYSGQNSSAGGLEGYKGNYYQGHGDRGLYGYGGTQTAGGQAGANGFSAVGTVNAGSFGVGGDNFSYSSGIGAGGGGGGYYGGGAGGGTGSGGNGHGAGGGSSFISGHSGCNAIKETSTSTSISHSGGENHYSGYKFYNTVMIDGQGYKWTTSKGALTLMPNPDGGNYLSGVGHKGDGRVKITFVG